MKKITALVLLIGLVGAPTSYAGNAMEVAQATTDTEKPAPVVTTPTESVSASPSPAVPQPLPHEAALKKDKTGDDFITLNFTNIEISALVKVMSELMRRNFLLDEHVTGKVTIMTPKKISPDEAYQVFLSALEIKGFTAIDDGKVTRIIPAAIARQSGLKVLTDGDTSGEGYVTKLIRLNFVNPQEVVRTITPLVSKDGSVIAYTPTSSIILTDSVSNVQKIESLVHAMDVVAPEGRGKINVYYLKNANAEEIGKLMQGLVAHLPAPPAAGSPQPPSASTILEGAVTITADKSTNSLIVVASPTDFETMKGVIQKLDIRRREVFVEVAIIEMSLSKMTALGFEFQAANLQSLETSNSLEPIGGTNFGNIGNAIANGPAALASVSGLAIGAVKGTFMFKGVEYMNVGALLTALQTDNDVNVLSTPNILTMDNQKAEIMVGENIPFVTGQTQNAVTGSGALFNTITREDVGIKLTLTPQISSDDNVRLEVNQEVSSVIAGTTANTAGPTTSKRQATTTVVVKDRQTMVIGGLIQDNVTTSVSKIPLLGDIPLLGWLFSSKQTTVDKTNLMIFITPYIIKNEGEASELTKQKKEALDLYRKQYHIEKKETEPIILTPRVSTAPQQPASAEPARIEAKPASELKTNSTFSPTKQAPAMLPESPASNLNTGISSSVQPPASIGTPKEGAQ